MPSPIAHTAMGYLVYRIGRTRIPQQGSRQAGSPPHLLMAAAALSMLPDLDAVLGVLMGDLGRFHNGVMHTLASGLVVALSAGSVVWLTRRSGFVAWFVMALLCFELHVILDALTNGRGVMLLWPFSSARYESPVPLFYGFHWSEGWISARHLWTLVTELGFAVCVGLAAHILPRTKRRARCA